MERSITGFMGTLSAFLSEIESTTESLMESIQQRPIPLDSAASSFLHRLDTQVSAAATDLERLESMAFGTVSFAELLGHCSEVYRVNQGYIAQLQERLKGFGYVPDLDGETGDFELDLEFIKSNNELEAENCGLDSVARATENAIEVDDIFESMSLKNLGLSDAGLATLASEDTGDLGSPEFFSSSYANGTNSENKISCNSVDVWRVQEKQPPLDEFSKGNLASDGLLQETIMRDMINISKEDYEKIPTYMKSLASWEEILQAVDNINSELRKRKNGSNESISFHADDLENFGFGRKGRSHLLLLLKMNKLVVDTEGGAVIYRVVVDASLP